MTRLVMVVALALALSLAATSVTVAQSNGDQVTLTVTVSDQAGNPIDGADLDLEWDGGSTTATTAANGKAFADVPPDAEVTIRVSHPRYVRNDPYVVSEASEREVGITVYRKSSVRLQVSDDDGRVADASVRIERGGLNFDTGTTDSNGVFESDVLQAGTYTVVVSKPGYYTRRKPLEIDGDITNNVAIRRGSVPVTVRVVDPNYDPARPVSGAAVNLTGIATAQTNRDGNATMTAPVNTETTLRVTRDGYRTVERDLTVGEAPETVPVTFSRTRSITLEATNERMVAGERVILRATDAYGDGAAVARVFLDGEQVGTTDGEGEVAVRITDPGTHTLYVSKNGVRSNEVQVEAISADDADETATPTATVTETPTATATETPTPTTGTSPGFAPALVVIALLVVAGRFARR